MAKKEITVKLNPRKKTSHVIRSFRIEAETLKRAEKKAKELGYSLNGLVQALLDSAVK